MFVCVFAKKFPALASQSCCEVSRPRAVGEYEYRLLLMLLKVWKNLVKFSCTSELLYTSVQLVFLNAFWRAILSNLLKSLISILLGKGLSVGSYERAKTGRWSAISIAMLPLVLEDTKLERMWSIQLVVDSITRVASRIKGLKPFWVDQVEVFFCYCALDECIDVEVN